MVGWDWVCYGLAFMGWMCLGKAEMLLGDT